MEPFLLIVLAALTLYFLYSQSRKPSKFPPGPPRIPIVGSFPFVLGRGKPGGPKTLLLGILQNTKKYGKVLGFWVGKVPTVVLADYHQIVEVLKSADSAARPNVSPINEYRPRWQALNGTENEGNVPGVMFALGSAWQEQRRFLLRNLKEFGFGKKGSEDLVLDEVEKLVGHFKKLCGQPLSLRGAFSMSVVNGLLKILVGESLDLECPEDVRTIRAVMDTMDECGNVPVPVANFLPHPKLANLLGIKQASGLARLEAGIAAVSKFFDKFLEQHIATFDERNIRDFLDLYLAEIYKTTDPVSSFYKESGMCFLANNLFELFFAGSDTTASSLQWTFLYLLHHPKAKQRVQKEIEEVCGSVDMPTLKHKDDLPYTLAVLHESLRLTCTVPLTPRKAVNDIPVGDFVIPKGATIFPSAVDVMRDPAYFEDADVFHPERFLTSEGKFKSCDRVIPFGVGKRVCLGQVLAEQQLFLFFAGIMKNFDFHLAPTENLPSYGFEDFKSDIVVRPPPDFKVIFSTK